MTEPEKLDLRSRDIASEKIAELLRLFPNVRTEGGMLDFERLKLALGETVDVGKERYGMNWPGKADCFKTIQTPSVATLRPCPEESFNFETSENLIIEGDNLEVLKLLQKSYLGKVKMIYIDPPYNTGGDFIYPDDYAESLRTYLEYTGQIDAEGRKFGTNTDADGRFHSKWMNMLYPRLYLARDLLRDDGVIFITIDDSELHNLLRLCGEVFGDENHVATVCWQKKVSPSNDAKWFSTDHDYIVTFAKSKATWRPLRLPMNERQKGYYTNPDDDPRGDWNSSTYTCNKSKEERPNLYYPIKNPNTGEEVWPKETAVWAYSRELHAHHVRDNCLYWGVDGRSKMPRLKKFLTEAGNVVPRSVWFYDDVGHTQEATKELMGILPESGFDTPKPTRLLRRMLQIAVAPDQGELVLDFFAGSGTTAHAVLEMNHEDGGNRKVILVQLPEPIDNKRYSTIADVCKERVRKVITHLKNEDAGKLNMHGGVSTNLGFRVYKLAESNFTEWDARLKHDAGALEKQLELHVEHIRAGRSTDDLLYELLLKSGFPLTTQVEKKTLAGRTVYSVAGGALVICLEQALTLELIRAIADAKPERVVCLDAGFAGNDQLKANAVQTFKTKGVTSFKTV